MFVLKNKYFLIIESIKDIDLSNIKISNKFNIIYRNGSKIENFDKLLRFRRFCKSKRIGFYATNNIKLSLALKTDGLYISAYNKNLRFSRLKSLNYKIIGSAHNLKELNIKILQGCSNIFFSRLFPTSYVFKKSFLGVIKYNLLNVASNANLVPLGGIRTTNLNKLKMVNCNSIALLSEIKKKPAKIFSRLF
jgi:thiamine-phosphate pyrophosphorylase